MTIRRNITAMALAAATAATVAGIGSPAQAEDGRNGAFLGGMLLGSMIAGGNGGYYAPPPRYYAPPPYYAPPRVIVRREYYYGPPRWRHHHRDRWHDHWDD